MSPAQDQAPALAEGRRIYLGNLNYIVQPLEIEEMLKANGFSEYDQIHISIDPVSARNPGYCFVDFKDRTDAERALASLNTTIRGRPLKVGPCEPKKQRASGWNSWKCDSKEPTSDRWGDWSGQRDETAGGKGSSNLPGHKRDMETGPYGAIKHFNEVVSSSDSGASRRLYIGGLHRMENQEQHQDEMRAILTGLNPLAIGQRKTPHVSTRTQVGHQHYCFVDFATASEAAAAVRALDGKEWRDENLRVNLSRSVPDRLRPRYDPRSDTESHQNEASSQNPVRSGRSSEGERSSSWRSSAGYSTDPSQPLKSLTSENWRRRE